MKIVSSGRVLNSPAFYQKKKKKRQIRFILLSLGCLALLSSLVYLSRQERFLITEVTILGEDVVDKDKIVQTTERLLSGHYLWIIPRANAFIYPRRAIEENLLKEFPRFKSVDLNLSRSRTLLVSVEERTPFALYCADASQCYFFDEDGFIFADAPSFSGNVYFIYRIEVPITEPLGQRFLSPEEFQPLPKFIQELSTLGISSLALEVGEAEYRLVLDNSGKIIWQRDSDLAIVYANLEAFLLDETIQAQNNFLDRILYLDLRTTNKVFYKFRE